MENVNMNDNENEKDPQTIKVGDHDHDDDDDSDEHVDAVKGTDKTAGGTTSHPSHPTHHPSNPLFKYMARNPWPFLVALPVAFAIVLAFGWSTNGKIEQNVSAIWVAQSGDYAADTDYAEAVGATERLGTSSFAALAAERNGGNMLTAENLEAVRRRMQETEETVITYKNVNFTWDDFCASTASPYQFPCLRLSPMDLYKEARWTFSTMDRVAWYRSVVQDRLIAPRLARFGGLTTTCQVPCLDVVTYRFQTGTPLSLFADVGNLEYNDNCKMCLEESYALTIQKLHEDIVPAFVGLSMQVEAFDATLQDNDTNAERKAENRRIVDNLKTLATTISANDVVDFYNYYVTRSLYAQLGVKAYLDKYLAFQPQIEQCLGAQQLGLPLACPTHPLDMNATMANQDLMRHADNVFSNVTAAGAPFPFWSQPDGTGRLFQPNPVTLDLSPVSGSGIDMSADMSSLGVFLQTSNNSADPTSPKWQNQVETNPLYAWFMASLTPAEPNTLCANGDLKGMDAETDAILAAMTPRWCTPFDVPNESRPQGSFSKQYFARMWYDLLIASDGFLGITQGQDDPYSWTTGAGCGYSLGGERYSYTEQSEQDILSNSSRQIYNIDEGVSLGPVDAHLLVGGVTPIIGEYSFDNPIQEVQVLQNLYAALRPHAIVQRVKNCARPGGPVELTEDEATELLKIWKEAMEDNWNRGWDDKNDGNVQFVSFYDDRGAIGSTGRMLTEITLNNSTLTVISILVITFFSALFLFSFDFVESRVLITLVGVGLVVLSFFSALGFGLLLGTKINVTIGWTLPFVIIGLGVDDVYIILMALKQQRGYTLQHWLKAMDEVVVPVTMTSLVNAVMFAILNVSDIPAIYLTSQIALYCVIALYLSVIFCFPAYCYLDLLRQKENRLDIAICVKRSNKSQTSTETKPDVRSMILYDYFYKPIVLNKGGLRYVFHALIMLVACALFGVGCYGVTERAVGLGLADFFPSDNPAGRWASIGEDTMATWSVEINWGAIDYDKPVTQMKMIKSFEDVVSDRRIGEADTKQLWMADFLVWTTRHCDENFDRPDFERRVCGRDQVFAEEGDQSICSGTWVTNLYGLREKKITSYSDETCSANEAGICRKTADMHLEDLQDLGLTYELAEGLVFCPVVDGWSDDKWVYCLGQWQALTGGGSNLLTEPGETVENTCGMTVEQVGKISWPIPYSKSPTLFSHSMFTHDDTLEMMRDTRRLCDDLDDIHCWLSGIPFDYWTQYDGIFGVLMELCGFATLGGFVIAFLFLFGKLMTESNHPFTKIVAGSSVGAALIACTMIITLTTVVGLSIISGVNLTGFSNMSFVLSVGFTVEYTVHVVSRWLRASSRHTDRVDFTMSFLMLPTFMSFVSSTIGTICLAFTAFEFIEVFFFRPLIIVMFVSYFYGCWFLPMVLTYLDFDFLKLGSDNDEDDADNSGKVKVNQDNVDFTDAHEGFENSEEQK